MRALPLGLALKLSTYLLVADGFAALLLAQVLSPGAAAGVAAAIAATWWADRVRHRLRPRLLTGIAVSMLAATALDALFLADSFFDGIVHLLILLLLYKLATWQTARDAVHLGVLSFFMLVAATAVTVSLAFLTVFVAFLVIGTWTFTLAHLRREAEVFTPAAARALEAARVVSPGFIGISLLFSLAALVLTAAIFFLLPRVGRAFLPLAARAGAMATGFSHRVELGGAGTIQADPTVVMRVHLPDLPAGSAPPGGLRWRGLTFDAFDGTTWTPASPWRRPVPRRFDGLFVYRPTDARLPLLRQEVDLDPLGTDVLFAAPRLAAVAGPLADLLTDEGGTALLARRPAGRLRYTAWSQPPGVGPFLETALPPAMAARYLRTPPLAPRVAALARELAAGASTPLEKARRLEAGLREGYRYSLTLQRDPRLDPLEDFLFQQRSGNCEYFASAMALMLRLEHVPARVVNGFQQGEWNEFGGYFTVRQRDAHAWVEAFIPGAGWMAFDPSPRAAFEAALGQGAGPVGRYLDFLRTRWMRYVVDYNLRDQLQAALVFRHETRRVREGVASTLGEWGRRLGLAAGGWRWLGVATVLCAAAALLGRRRGRIAGGRRGEVRFYARLRRALERRGFSGAPGETPLELARRAAAAGPDLAPAEDITRLYYRVRFGGQPLAPDESARVDALLAALDGAPSR